MRIVYTADAVRLIALFIALFRFKLGIFPVIASCALVSLGYSLLL